MESFLQKVNGVCEKLDTLKEILKSGREGGDLDDVLDTIDGSLDFFNVLTKKIFSPYCSVTGCIRRLIIELEDDVFTFTGLVFLRGF